MLDNKENLDKFLNNQNDLNLARAMAIKTVIEFNWDKEQLKLIKYLDLI